MRYFVYLFVISFIAIVLKALYVDTGSEKMIEANQVSENSLNNGLNTNSVEQKVLQVKPFSEQANNFKCDGRISCSQMHSCAEATFFIQNCPNTKMDGDDDGIPCETQWCLNQ